MKLTGQQYMEFQDALIHAFPRLSKLRQMVRFRLERNLDTITLGENLAEIAFDLIQTAEAEGWVLQLINAAYESNPGNPKLMLFVQQFGLAPDTPSRRTLERVIIETNSFLDVEKWHSKLGRLLNRVCRVEIRLGNGDFACGTGFLLGPDVVITNYHVIEPVIEHSERGVARPSVKALPGDVVFRFDYRRLKNGKTLNTGSIYQLADDWLIHCSPPSPLDELPEPKTGVPRSDQLDYALLRLRESPGYDPVGESPEPGASQRGWIELPTNTPRFSPDTPLFILQHPEGQPLKLAFDTNSIIGLNENETRVMYRTNTEAGSSGSPCFDVNWQLVALHHWGDPNYTKTHRPTYNQGIPFGSIVQLLELEGVRESIGI